MAFDLRAWRQGPRVPTPRFGAWTACYPGEGFNHESLSSIHQANAVVNNDDTASDDDDDDDDDDGTSVVGGAGINEVLQNMTARTGAVGSTGPRPFTAFSMEPTM